MSEEPIPAPLDTGSPASSAARADDVQHAVPITGNAGQYTPVHRKVPTGFPAADPDDPRARERSERLADLEFRLEVERRLTKLARLRARRILLWLGVLAAIASVLHGIWSFFHPSYDFEPVLSDVTYFAGSVGLYLLGRFGKDKPDPDAPGPDSRDEDAALLRGAGKLTGLFDDP